MARDDDLEESLDKLMRAEVAAYTSPLMFVVAHTRATRKFESKPYVVAVLTRAIDKGLAKEIARVISRDSSQRITLKGPMGATYWDSGYDK